MTDTPSQADPTDRDAGLAVTLQIYESGLFLKAHASLAATLGGDAPVSVAESQLAARIATQLGCATGRAWLLRRAARADPTDPLAKLCHASYLLTRGRLLDALHWLDSEEPHDAGHVLRARWLSLRAEALFTLRDFAAAEVAIHAAEAIAPGDLWSRTDLPTLRWYQDRREEAIAILRERLAVRDDYWLRSFLCQALQEARSGDALAEFEAANARYESALLAGAYAQALLESGQVARARDAFERNLARFPMADHRWRAWTAQELALCHHELGDDSAALAVARGDRSLVELSTRLETGAGRARRLLPVAFVAQDYMTCVPATLAAVLAWHGVTVDQRAVAAEITFDGTSDHKEREWCRRHGLVHREFHFEPGIARALIDREVPFTLSTRDPQGGHLQAVVGYDAGLSTWFTRDPGQSRLCRFDEEDLRLRADARSARCVVVLPPDRADRVAGLEFPREASVQALTSLGQALEQHRLGAAQEHLATIVAAGPSVQLWDAEQRIGSYLRDAGRVLRAARAQHAASPKDAHCQYLLVSALLSAGRRAEAEELLAQWHTGGWPHPMLTMHRVDLCRTRATTRPLARSLMRHVLRRLPCNAAAVSAAGHLQWADAARRDKALLRYRIAACLDPFDENRARTYWDALRMLGRADEGLAWLEERAKQLSHKSSAPAGTHADALQAMHRVDEAILVLRAGLARHEEERTRHALIAHLLDAHRVADARVVLAESDGRMRPSELHRLHAWAARLEGNPARTLEHLEAAAAVAPDDPRIHSERLALIAALKDKDAAVAAADALLAAHPGHVELLRIAVDAYGEAGRPERAEQCLVEHVGRHEDEFWPRHDLIRMLLLGGRYGEALPHAERLVALHDDIAASHLDRAGTLARLQRSADAIPSLRRAIELDIENPWAITRLVEFARPGNERRQQLLFVADQMLHQGSAGQALSAWLDAGRNVLDHAEREAFVARLQQELPGSPEPGEARCGLLLELGRATAARELAAELCARFPYRLEAQELHAKACRANGDPGAAIAILERVVAARPERGRAAVSLGELLEAHGEPARAEQVYRAAAAAAPDLAVTHGYLAELLYRRGAHDEALGCLRRAIDIDGAYRWAIETEQHWLIDLGRSDEALARAREHVARRPDLAATHLCLARACLALGHPEAGFEALRAAVRVAPHEWSGHDDLVMHLAQRGRATEADEALDAAEATIGPIRELRGRRIWVRRSAGDQDQAVRQMEELVASEPDYEAGWRWLCEWLDEEGRHQRLVELGERTPPVLEGSGYFWCLAASAARQLGRWTSAEQFLRKAAACGADPLWCDTTLLAVLDLRKSRDEALRHLRSIQEPRALDPQILAWRFRLAVRGDDHAERETALGLFLANALRSPAAEAWRLVLEEWTTGIARKTRAQLTEIMRARTDTRFSVEVLRALTGESNDLAARLRERRLGEERDSAIAWLGELLGNLDEWDLLAQALAKVAGEGIHDESALAYVVCALARRPFFQLAIRAAGDWRRPTIQAWTLANLGFCYMALRRPRDARAAFEQAFTRPEDHSFAWIRPRLACLLLDARETVAAEAQLQQIAQPEESSVAMIHVVRAALLAKGEPRARVRMELDQAFAADRKSSEPLRGSVFWPPVRRILWRLRWRAPILWLLCLGRYGYRLLGA